MTYEWHDFVGNLGVGLILLCYFLNQIQRLTVADLSYSVLNALGALLLMISFLINFNLSGVVIEVAWLAISLYAIARTVLRRRRGNATSD